MNRASAEPAETVEEWVARHLATAPSWQDLSSAQRDQLRATFARSATRGNERAQVA